MMERNKAVAIWLFIGVVMLFFQIIIGGVTRLTGSGLSITKWEIVTGTLPPLSEENWEDEFDKYKATPQYHKINKGMSLPDFKFIYFWEYFHRLWARSMGLVFLFPLIWFLWKKKIRKVLKPHLAGVFTLAALVASFGWIMVASGLVDRPWVNAYKLTVHLSLGILLYAWVLWLAMDELLVHKRTATPQIHKWTSIFIGLLTLQIILGGLMSGMKAALIYPTWPDMGGSFIPPVLLDFSNFSLSAFTHYDTNIYAMAFVQFFHRNLAYLLTIFGIILWLKAGNKQILTLNPARHLFLLMLFVQVALGIITILMSKGQIPVFWGV
ncbi:MAG: COX15/CtaA family protein, partial [Chitinophagales bacterium]